MLRWPSFLVIPLSQGTDQGSQSAFLHASLAAGVRLPYHLGSPIKKQVTAENEHQVAGDGHAGGPPVVDVVRLEVLEGSFPALRSEDSGIIGAGP